MFPVSEFRMNQSFRIIIHSYQSISVCLFTKTKWLRNASATFSNSVLQSKCDKVPQKYFCSFFVLFSGQRQVTEQKTEKKINIRMKMQEKKKGCTDSKRLDQVMFDCEWVCYRPSTATKCLLSLTLIGSQFSLYVFGRGLLQVLGLQNQHLEYPVTDSSFCKTR